MNDADKMRELEKDENKVIAQALLGTDTAKTQDVLRKTFALQHKHCDEEEQSKMSSPDLLRTECTGKFLFISVWAIRLTSCFDYSPPRSRGALPADAQSRTAVRPELQAPVAGVDPAARRGRAT